MNRMELLEALGKLSVETGSLACLGCGYEHNCNTHGCAILRAAKAALKTARAKDKQTMLDLIIEAKKADPETGSFAEWLAGYLVEHLPIAPNEPLTFAELEEMGGQPVWLEPLQWWALINSPNGLHRVIFRLSGGGWRAYYSDEELQNDGLTIYRRPPEGENHDPQ